MLILIVKIKLNRQNAKTIELTTHVLWAKQLLYKYFQERHEPKLLNTLFDYKSSKYNLVTSRALWDRKIVGIGPSQEFLIIHSTSKEHLVEIKDQTVACIGLLNLSACMWILDINCRTTANNSRIRNEMMKSHPMHLIGRLHHKRHNTRHH